MNLDLGVSVGVRAGTATRQRVVRPTVTPGTVSFSHVPQCHRSEWGPDYVPPPAGIARFVAARADMQRRGRVKRVQFSSKASLPLSE
jgi:hypothetical protein